MALSPLELADLLVQYVRGMPTIEKDELPRDPIPEQPKVWALEHCGAWTGSGSIASEKTAARDVKFSRSIGLTRLILVVNDHSTWRSAHKFETYDRAKVIRFCRAARDAGLVVDLMSWIMPHEAYLREGIKILRDLKNECEAEAIQFDAEEPWTQAVRPMNYDEAGALVAELMSNDRYGTTGIGYASTDKLGPLVRGSAYMVPQAYVTDRSKLEPSDVYDLALRWKRMFGSRELDVGLAAYNQSQIAGHTLEQAMRASFTSALAAKPRYVTWWSLTWIRGSTKIASVIKSLTTHNSTKALIARSATPQENA